MDEGKHQALAVVNDSQLSLAIGKQGNNVKLANKLVDWAIDVKTESQFAEIDIASESRRAVSELFNDEDYETEEYSNISQLPGVDLDAAGKLKDNNLDFIEDFIAVGDADLINLGISQEQIDELRKLLEEYVDIIEETEEVEEEAPPEAEEEDEEEYECPECGAKITLDMTNCPSCGIGLSFEYQDEE